jgi:hypothetical protein
MMDWLASSALLGSPLSIAALVLGAAGALLVLAGIAALIRLRPLRFALRTLAGLLLLSLAGLAGAVFLGVQGYRALAREDLAARVSVRPTGPQAFAATVRYPDGRQAGFALAGDEIYVDARILKWKPIASVFGLHTAYELDRVAGRYRDLEQERNARRTVYALGEEKPVDLFGLRRRHGFLAPLFDAEYGSASFVPVTEPAELELRVSATGLLIREIAPAPRP